MGVGQSVGSPRGDPVPAAGAASAPGFPDAGFPGCWVSGSSRRAGATLRPGGDPARGAWYGSGSFAWRSARAHAGRAVCGRVTVKRATGAGRYSAFGNGPDLAIAPGWGKRARPGGHGRVGHPLARSAWAAVRDGRPPCRQPASCLPSPEPSGPAMFHRGTFREHRTTSPRYPHDETSGTLHPGVPDRLDQPAPRGAKFQPSHDRD